MSLRWRSTGELLCGANSEPLKDDCYIDDRLHYQLSLVLGVVRPDPNEEETGVWHWAQPHLLVASQDMVRLFSQVLEQWRQSEAARCPQDYHEHGPGQLYDDAEAVLRSWSSICAPRSARLTSDPRATK